MRGMESNHRQGENDPSSSRTGKYNWLRSCINDMNLQETHDFATQQRQLIGTRNQPTDYEWEAIKTSTSEKVEIPNREGLFAGMPKRSEYSAINYLDDFEQDICREANKNTDGRNKAQNFVLKMVKKIERIQLEVYEVKGISYIAKKRAMLDINKIKLNDDEILRRVSNYIKRIRNEDEYKAIIGKIRTAGESQATPQVNGHISTPASTAGESSTQALDLNVTSQEKDPWWDD